MKIKFKGMTFRLDFAHETGAWLRRTEHADKRIEPLELVGQKLERIQRLSLDPDLRSLAKSFQQVADEFRSELVNTTNGPIVAKRRTVARVVVEHGDHEHLIATGIAYLSPNDHFSRPVGRQVALERALMQLAKPELRGRLLAAYVLRKGVGHLKHLLRNPELPAMWEAERSPEATELAFEAIDFVAEAFDTHDRNYGVVEGVLA